MEKETMQPEMVTSDQEDTEATRVIIFRTGDNELSFRNGITINDDPEVIDFLLTLHQQTMTEAKGEETEVADHDPFMMRRMGALAAKLYEVTGDEEVVKAETADGSRKTLQYSLSSSLHIVDKRVRYAEVQQNTLEWLQRQVEHMEPYAPATRLFIFKECANIFINHSRTFGKLTQLYKEAIIPNIGMNNFVAYGEPPTRAETRNYLLQLELGIVTFFEEQDMAVVEDALLGMIEAYYSLFYKHYCLIADRAVFYRHRPMDHQQLTHEARVALLDLISDYLAYKVAIIDPEESSEGDAIEESFIANKSSFTDQAAIVIDNAMQQFSWFSYKKITPRKIAERQRLIEEKRTSFINTHGYSPSYQQIGYELGLSEQEVIGAIFDKRRSRTIFSRQENNEKSEGNIDQSLEMLGFKDKIDLLLQSDSLTDREKIVISLHYGVFVDQLRGAEFMPKSPFIYPQSEDAMPSKPLTIREVSELLEIRFNTVRAMLLVGLRACKSRLQSQGIESVNDIAL